MKDQINLISSRKEKYFCRQPVRSKLKHLTHPLPHYCHKEEEEDKPITKPKRVLTEKQLESLKKAREAAALKKRELKELAQKAKALTKKK